jgi:hypothetical protein
VPLIIEDGSGVADANSYVELVELRDFAANRGYLLPTEDEEAEALAVRAADYLLAIESRFKGRRATPVQSMAWPRVGAWFHGFAVAPDSIPLNIRLAQCQLAVDAMTVDLLPATDGRAVIREKIGDLETEYSDTGGTAPAPQLDAANKWLAPFFGAQGLQTIRI